MGSIEKGILSPIDHVRENLPPTSSFFSPLPSRIAIRQVLLTEIQKRATKPKSQINYGFYDFYIDPHLPIVYNLLTNIVYPDVCFVLRGYKAASIRNGRRRLSFWPSQRFQGGKCEMFLPLSAVQSHKGKRPGFQTFILQAGPPRSAQIEKSFVQLSRLRKTNAKKIDFPLNVSLTYCKNDLVQEKRLIFFNFQFTF